MINNKEFPFAVFFKNRTPNSDLCTVIDINFEKKTLEVSNGAVRLYPKFEEVNLYRIDGFNMDGSPTLVEVFWFKN